MSESKFSLVSTFVAWWHQQREETSVLTALQRVLEMSCEFVRDSLPDRRRQRYGDIDFDWEQRVNTTGATVTWRTRLLGTLNSPYQPIPPEQFREIMSALRNELAPATDFGQFTFIDIGSGKGRALLLASEFGFRRIIGIELLPELDRIARDNVSAFKSAGSPAQIELFCEDATTFDFPAEPTVIFLFNPLREAVLRTFLQNVESSLRQSPRMVYVAYANPILEQAFTTSSFVRLSGTHQFLLFRGSGG
jgi:SAM-dependent methyltransferase